MPYHSLLCFLFTGQIKDLLVSSSIDFGTMMVFINTVYFKGIWKTAFNTEDTQEMPFRMTKVGTWAPQLEKFKKNCSLLTLSHASVLQQESKPVQMMCLNDTFNVATLPAEKMKILELPYASGELSMLVLLPDEVSGLEQVRPWQGKATSSELSGSWLPSDLWLSSHPLAVLCCLGRGAQQWPRCFQVLRQRLASKENPGLNVIK